MPPVGVTISDGDTAARAKVAAKLLHATGKGSIPVAVGRATAPPDSVDYQFTWAEDFTAAPERYDLIIDVVANRPASHYRRCLKPGGRLVVIGGTISSLLGILAASLFSHDKTLSILPYKVSPEDNLTLAAKVRPVIDRTFPLEDGAKALRRLGEGRAIGKVVITTN